MPEPKKPLNRYILWATAISVTASAIIGTMHAAGIMEPYWLATRGFTRSVVSASEKETGSRLLALEIYAREASRDLIVANLDRLEVEAHKNVEMNDGIKQILNEQIGRYRVQLRSVENELERLRKQQSHR